MVVRPGQRSYQLCGLASFLEFETENYGHGARTWKKTTSRPPSYLFGDGEKIGEGQSVIENRKRVVSPSPAVGRPPSLAVVVTALGKPHQTAPGPPS